jgi:hypothetical protein
LLQHKYFALGRLLNVVREAFNTRKRLLGVPTVSFAGWVGTIKHSAMADGVETAEQRHSWCGWMRAIVRK